MREISEQEKKDKRFSVIVSAIIHTGLIVLFIFLVAWRMPDPPIPEYGMELNMGFDDQGSGDNESEVDNPDPEIENETPPESELDAEEQNEEVIDEPVEEVVEEITEPVEEVTEPVEEVVEPVEEVTEPVKEVVDPVEATQETTSDVTATEEKKVEEKKEEEEKPEEKPKEEEKKPVEKPKEVDKRALMGGASQKSDAKSNEKASSNEGRTTDARGNMGKPEGKKDAKGEQPGDAAFGVSLDLDGWKWDSPPADKDDSQIDGVIIFNISVDDRGDVQSVVRAPGTTISDGNVINFYRKQVQKLIFIRKANTEAAAAISKGKITFVIKTK